MVFKILKLYEITSGVTIDREKKKKSSTESWDIPVIRGWGEKEEVSQNEKRMTCKVGGKPRKHGVLETR